MSGDGGLRDTLGDWVLVEGVGKTRCFLRISCRRVSFRRWGICAFDNAFLDG